VSPAAAVVAGAVPERRREFTSVRVCARKALRRLGCPPVPLVPDAAGAPVWPQGVVGSMTHCRGSRAAAVAPAERWQSVGVDAEPRLPLPAGVLEAISLPEEREWLRALGRSHSEIPWDRLLFSTKVAVYKVWSPLTARRLEFEQARVTLRPDGSYLAELLVPRPPFRTLIGRWSAGEEYLVTAAAVPRAI
jgi:4'-phosphopantetheinyl transferase EntD